MNNNIPVLELNDKKEWEIYDIWLNSRLIQNKNDEIKIAKMWFEKKENFPPILDYYNGQVLKAKIENFGKITYLNVRIKRILAYFDITYNSGWTFSFDCDRIDHGHWVSLSLKNLEYKDN